MKKFNKKYKRLFYPTLVLEIKQRRNGFILKAKVNNINNEKGINTESVPIPSVAQTNKMNEKNVIVVPTNPINPTDMPVLRPNSVNKQEKFSTAFLNNLRSLHPVSAPSYISIRNPFRHIYKKFV